MTNISQITNYDLDNVPSITKTIERAGKIITYPYKIVDNSILKGIVTKLGYCCEVKGIGYPIFLLFSKGEEKPFEIGKTGMFEFQPEEWLNINGDNIKRTATVYCTEVLVPADIKFTLDYWCTY